MLLKGLFHALSLWAFPKLFRANYLSVSQIGLALLLFPVKNDFFAAVEM